MSGEQTPLNTTTRTDGEWCEVIHDCEGCPGLDTYGYGEMVPKIVAEHVAQYGCSVRYTRKTSIVTEPLPVSEGER